MTVSIKEVYSQLKNQIIFSVGLSDRHSYLLTKLKGLFREDINSPRRFEEIQTIGDLLKILEIRDLLSEENLQPLKIIAGHLPNSNELIKEINDFEAIPKEPNGNYYATQNNRKTRESAVHLKSNIPYGQMSEEKRKRILQIVTVEIGNAWRDLARYLGIRERVINDIDKNNRTLTKKATQLIEIYLEAKAEPDKWLFDLRDALEKARRKDLSNDIKKILLMNI